MTSLLTGLALCCLLAHARGLRRFSYPFSLAVPSPFLSFSLSLSPLPLFLSLSDNSRSQPQHTVAEEPVCARARANARCNGNDGRDNTDALSHAYTFTQSRIEHRLRSLSEFNDPSTRPSRARPAPSTTPSRSLPLLRQSLALARSPHTTFYLSLTSRVFFVSRSPSSPPPAFLFLQRWIYLPVFHSSPPPSPPPLPSRTDEHLIAPPYRTPSFFSFGSPFPLALALSYILFPDSVSSCPSSFPSGLLPSLPLFPSRRPPPPSSAMAHWSTGMVHCAVCYSRSFPSSFTIFHASATHSVQSNGSARVQRLRGENPEGGEARERERERPPFSRPQRGMGYRGPIMDLSVGCCWCCCNCLRSSEGIAFVGGPERGEEMSAGIGSNRSRGARSREPSLHGRTGGT